MPILRRDILLQLIHNQSKEKSKDIKFKVGTIVTHVPTNNVGERSDMHDGVIIGWDYKYNRLHLPKPFDFTKGRCMYNVCNDSCKIYGENEEDEEDEEDEEYEDDEKMRCNDDHMHYIILSEYNQMCYVKEGMSIINNFVNCIYCIIFLV